MTTCWRVWTVFGAQSGRVSTDCLWYFSCMNKRCCPAGWCLRLLLRNTHAAFKCRQGKQDCKLKLSESRADRRWFPLFTQYFIQSTLFILLISFRRLSEPKSRRKWQKFVDSTVHSNSEEPEPSICLLMWGIKSLKDLLKKLTDVFICPP